MITQPRTTPFFCYYGGKWRSAPLYGAPQQDTIVEPFAGAAGFSTRWPLRQVLLYDVDPVVVALWSYLISVDEAEILALPDVREHVDELPASVCAEARALIGFWLNKGTTEPGKSPSRWMRDNWRADTFWGRHVRRRIAAQLWAVRHWRVEQRSWEDVPMMTATWFVDPPYDNAAGQRYRHHDVDHAALGAWCQSLPGQVIVCEQAGADWLPFTALASVKTSRAAHSREVVWTNEPAAQSRLFA